MFKNVASTFLVFAFDTTTNAAKTGDAANITAYVKIDGGSVTVLGDTTATEEDATNAPGYYSFTAAQAETNGDRLMISAKSSTANIAVIGAPAIIYTRPTTGWLAPTTAGRTLDVSAGGEAGIDWANIGSPTTAVALTGTTIAVTQKVDVDTIKTNPVVNGGTVTFPTNATLASTTNITAGTVTTATNVTTVNGLAANVITAASMAADASAEIADAVWDEDATGHQTGGTFGQAIGDPGADTNTIFKAVVTDATGATVGVDVAAVLADTGTDGVVVASIAAGAITAAAIADGAIDAATFAAGAITASAIAADAIGASELAADAVAEIADAVWDEALAGHAGAGSAGEALSAAGTAGDPWTTALPGAYGAGTAGKIIGDNINATISSRASQASVDTIDGIVDDILVDTGTTLQGELDGIQADTEDIQSRLPAALTGDGNIKADMLRVGGTLQTAGDIPALVTTVDTVVDAVKAKTDSLTFTVANQVDSNVQYVNDVQVTGNGETGTEWGPA